MKIYFDGVVDLSANLASCGGVIRDSTGSWLRGFVSNIGACSPALAEAWALLRSIQLAIQMRFQNVIFEGDSREIVEGV